MAEPCAGAKRGSTLDIGRYPPEAYQFVREGLEHTVRTVHGSGDNAPPDRSRHVDGRQLCLGLRDYAVQQYGALTRVVLRRWRVQSTDDFGRIVFNMVEAGLLSRSEEDSLEDFRAVFDFDEAFGPAAVR